MCLSVCAAQYPQIRGDGCTTALERRLCSCFTLSLCFSSSSGLTDHSLDSRIGIGASISQSPLRPVGLKTKQVRMMASEPQPSGDFSQHPAESSNLEEVAEENGGVAAGNEYAAPPTLMTRVEAKHRQYVTSFQDGIRQLNREMDAQQRERVGVLKSTLKSSHEEIATTLSSEQSTIDVHRAYLNDVAETMAKAPSGSVCEPVVDAYHSRDDLDFVMPRVRMQEERERLIQLAVWVRTQYQRRYDTILGSIQELELLECERRRVIQERLGQLMIQLAQCSFCDVTGAHVLAQLVIHHINEQLAHNFLVIQTIRSQLLQREVLKLRQYHISVVRLLTSQRESMACSHVWWLRCLLQSAHFRRPRSRMEVIDRITCVAADAAREGNHFLDSLGVILQSLRLIRAEDGEGAVSVMAQPIGGSEPAGWLRYYDEDVMHDLFSLDPAEVVDEWRMKAIVVIRNSLSSIVDLANDVKSGEEVRMSSMLALRSQCVTEMDWLFKPLEGTALGECQLLPSASMHLGELDECFSALVAPAAGELVVFENKATETAQVAVDAITAECQWFRESVEAGLQASHRAFEDSILLAYKSVLRHFEKATETLEEAVLGSYGYMRSMFQRQEEVKQEYNDQLALKEEDFEAITSKLTHAASVQTARSLFADGIACLESISKSYMQYHTQFLESLREMKEASVAKSVEVFSMVSEKMGVEREGETQERLHREWQRRMDEAVAKATQEQAHSRRGRGGRRGRNDSPSDDLSVASSTPSALSTQLFQIEAEMSKEPPVTYPQLIIRGQQEEDVIFNIISPLRLIEDVVVAAPPPPVVEKAKTGRKRSNSSKGAKGGKRSKSPALAKDEKPAPAAADESAVSPTIPAAVAVDKEFKDCYTPLLQTTIFASECFVHHKDVDRWLELLRKEVMGWVLKLCHQTVVGVEAYAAKSSSNAEVNISFLLRNHRRRPATFQADAFEARVRELENKSSQSEKYCARLIERVGKLESMVEQLFHDPQQAGEDTQVLKDLVEMERKVKEVSSKHVLQVLERRYAGRVSHFIDSYAVRRQRVLETAEKQREAIEADVQHYLQERERQLELEEYGEGTLEEAVAKDVLSCRVRNVSTQLDAIMARVAQQATDELEERVQRMKESREAFERLHQCSVEELKLLAYIQESGSRVKTQVQTILQRSKSEEDRVAVAIRTVEELLQRTIPRPRIEESLRPLFLTDYGLVEDGPSDAATAAAPQPPNSRHTAASRPSGSHSRPKGSIIDAANPLISGPGGGVGSAAFQELPDDIEEQIHEELDATVFLNKVQYQRLVQSSPVAELFTALDTLRESLYCRGIALNALSWAPELLRVQPENYIEPRIPPKDAEGAAAAAAPSSSSSSGKRRVRATKGGGMLGAVPLDPLPQVVTMESQVVQWVNNMKKDVLAALQQHFQSYPPPLLRSSQVLFKATSQEDALAAVEKLAQAPLKRFSDALNKSTVTYHEHVQRLFVAMQLVPQFLSSSLLQLASHSLSNRVMCVMKTYGQFYSRSSHLKVQHQRLVKVSLASQSNREKLQQLNYTETARQAKTLTLTTWLWGWVIRELQEEVGLHAARCVNTTNTFFQLLKGLISPEHLTPCEVVLTVGYHRGLKHLLRLRDRDNRLRDIADAEGDSATSSARRSSAAASVSSGKGGKAGVQVPDCVPVFRVDGGGKDSKGQARGGAAAAGGEGGMTVPVPQYTEVDYPGLPVFRFRPLEEFNAAHPSSTPIPAPLAARQYYPLPPVDAGTPNLTTSVGGGGGGGKRGGKRGVVKPEAEEEKLSPPITGPVTRLHQQSVVFAAEALEELSRSAEAVVGNANASFQSIEARELQWEKTWKLMASRLTNSDTLLGHTISAASLAAQRAPTKAE